VDRIPVAGPWITEREIAGALEAVTRGWYSDAGRFQREFEEAFARHLGRRHAVSLPSCTAGIHLALCALGVGPGDEVVVPDATWIATAAPISYVGATPVFADIDPLTWCVTAESLEACLSPRTRAVIVVDLYGGMPDMNAIQELTRRREVAVIEDAAEAIGSEWRGQKAGSYGEASVFSFHGSKTLTTGEGGMLVTDRDDILDRALQLRDHGRRPSDRAFWNLEVGFKYRMSAMQAALGSAQLERLPELIDRKRAIFRWYEERLGTNPDLKLNAEPEGCFNSYWMVTAVIAENLGLSTVEVRERLGEAGIDTRPFFHPLSSLPAYSGTPQALDARLRNVAAYHIAPRALNLPSALILDEAKVDRVCSELRTSLRPRPEADQPQSRPRRAGSRQSSGSPEVARAAVDDEP
jgi:perosamine synthetase